MRGDVCLWWGRSKIEREGGTWVVGKKIGKKKEKINEEVWYMGGGDKRKEKRKKKWEGGVLWEKKWRGKERKEKIEREKTKLVLVVCSLCLMPLFDTKCRIVKICLKEVNDIFLL